MIDMTTILAVVTESQDRAEPTCHCLMCQRAGRATPSSPSG